MNERVFKNYADLERFIYECNHFCNKKDEEERYGISKENKEEE